MQCASSNCKRLFYPFASRSAAHITTSDNRYRSSSTRPRRPHRFCRANCTMASPEVRLQNLALLCKQLRLPVSYKVLEVLPDNGDKALPDVSPDTGNDAVPKAVPGTGDEAVPDTLPDMSPDTGNEAVPEAVRGAGDEAVPGTLPDVPPDTGNEAVLEAVPGTGDEALPDTLPGTGNEAVPEAVPGTGNEALTRSFMVVVHVMGDHSFKKYLQNCSLSDMLLYRGLLLKVCATASLDRILSARVQQAFLPKFENEGQDSSIADAIVDGADNRYMVVTIKHSGSLVTLSSAGFAAKNSVANEFTAGAAALLQAHFERSSLSVRSSAEGEEVVSAQQRLEAFMRVLADRDMAVSFEMVTGCHGHHGQLPRGEYLVTTSAHTMDAHGNPSFLPWRSFLNFCIEQGLPTNDTWLIAGHSWANAARDTLDELALSGGPTKQALGALDKIVEEGSAAGSVHLPGTYPHADWQGTRIEGFVIAQGEEITPQATQLLLQLRPAMQAAVLPLGSVPEELKEPYRDLVASAKGHSEDWKSKLQAATASWLPAPKLESVTGVQRDTLIAALLAGDFCSANFPLASTHTGVERMNTDEPASDKTGMVVGMETDSGDGAQAQTQDTATATPATDAIGMETDSSDGAQARIQASATATPATEAVGMETDASDGAQAHTQDTATATPATKVCQARLPTGGVACSRKAMQACSAEDLLGMLTQALLSGGDSGALEAAKAVLAAECASATSTEDGSVPMLSDTTQVKAIQALSGVPDTGSTTLRYKKKMSMWSRAEGDEDAVMGYCMMTFVIRNGLQALGFGVPTYMNYVDSLVRSWGLPLQHGNQVRMFARAWAAWFGAHHGPSAVSSDHYLDAAEPFVKAFIAASCKAAANGDLGTTTSRAADAFQGVVALLDVPAPVVEELKKALKVQTVIDTRVPPPVVEGEKEALKVSTVIDTRVKPGAVVEVPFFSNSMVAQGTILVLSSETPVPIAFRSFVALCGPYLYAVVKRPSLPDAMDPDSPHAKKLKGLHMSQVKMIEFALEGAKEKGAKAKGPKVPAVKTAPPPSKRITLLEEDGAANVGDLIRWLGAGTPLPPLDPASICCFVSIPGVGKTALTDGLDSASIPGVSGVVSLKVLNSDRMKNTVKNFQGNRYWHEVAAAASTHVGAGRITVVVADKNLVPSPPGNIDRALNVMKDAGGSCVAVVPTCVGGQSSWQLCPSLYQGLPDLPFPLELVALCMLRTLTRKKHEGHLDASLPVALGVLCKFVNYFRNTTKELLLERLGSCFTVVKELPVMSIPEGALELQVPEALLRHIALGVALCGEVTPEWEQQCRSMLTDPAKSAAILALQRPLEACRSDLHSALAASLAALSTLTDASSANPLAQPSISTALGLTCSLDSGSVGAEGGDKAEGSLAPQWIAVSGFDAEPLRQAAQQLLAPDLAAKLKGELHVTLWHAADPVLGTDTKLLEELLSSVGQEVVVEVIAIDSSPQITAAQVRLASGPESCYEKKPYLHITMMVGAEAQAKDSNLLPGMLAEGTATRVAIPGGLQLTGGRILAFMAEASEPLPALTDTVSASPANEAAPPSSS